MQRDLIGYGKNAPKIEWPGGARIAVSLVVNYEEGAERSTSTATRTTKPTTRCRRRCRQATAT